MKQKTISVLFCLVGFSTGLAAHADDCGDWVETGRTSQYDSACAIAGGDQTGQVTDVTIYYARQCTDSDGNSYTDTTFDFDACV